MIVIIDYGMCNVGSVRNMLKKVGVKSIITSDVDDIAQAEKLILPGVGSFDKGMEQLEKMNIIDVLNRKVLIEKKPILGICLGMQLMTKSSTEGGNTGLGWIPAQAKKFELEEQYRVPHMGWNFTTTIRINDLTKGLIPESRFYFVHSYYVECEQENNVMLSCDYGQKFTAGICSENIFGVQFHPEKSHKYGMQLLRNFAKLQVLEKVN